MNISHAKVTDIILSANRCVNVIIGHTDTFNQCTHDIKLKCQQCIFNFKNIKKLIKKYNNELK